MIKTNISKDWFFEENFRLGIVQLGGNTKKKVDLPHDYVISHPRSKDARACDVGMNVPLSDE